MTFGFANLSGGGSVEEVLAAAVLDFVSSPVRLCDVLTASQRLAFYNHFRNDNGLTNFAMGFRDEAGKPVYKKSAKKTFEEIISWSIATMLGKSKPGREMSFVPYATNADAHSRWAVLDFDAHDGEIGRAYGYTREAYRYLIRKNVVGVVFLIEHTGEGGWHLWLLSPEFHSCAWWIALLEEVAASIGVPIKSGVCEIFPHDEDANNPKRKGVRAPGNWHPGNGKRGELYCVELLPAFIDALNEQKPPSALGLPKEEKGLFLASPPSEEHSPPGEVAPSEKKDSALAEGSEPLSTEKNCAREPAPYKRWETHWSLVAAINALAVRHERLAWLVGQMFYQVGRAMAELIVKLQFQQRSVHTNADCAEHREEFLELWRGLMDRWLATLSQPECDQLQRLMTETERDVYRILRGFHAWAVKNSSGDFPVAQADLAARLGISKQYAGQILAHFVACGILARTAPPVPHKAAARYRWQPPKSQSATSREQSATLPSASSRTNSPAIPLVPLEPLTTLPMTSNPSIPPTPKQSSTRASRVASCLEVWFFEIRLRAQQIDLPTIMESQVLPENRARWLMRARRAVARLVAADLVEGIDEDTFTRKTVPVGPGATNMVVRIYSAAISTGSFEITGHDGDRYLAELRESIYPGHAAQAITAWRKLVELNLLNADGSLNTNPDKTI